MSGMSPGGYKRSITDPGPRVAADGSVSTVRDTFPVASLSKGQINRAGAHLASRLREVRAGTRPAVVDERDPDDVRARGIVEQWRDAHVEPMLGVADVVATNVSPLEIDERELILVTTRSKRFSTIVDKLDRGTVRLADMVDLGGVRAVVEDIDDVDAAVEALNDELEVRRVRDWARNPPASGYRAVHLHVRQGERAIELQLRTRFQDTWANIVEEEARLSGVNYKAGQGSPEVLAFFAAMADVIAMFELGESPPDAARRLYDSYAEAKSLLHMPLLTDLDSR
jgi:putative GTP pyrophosphokinase